MERSKTGKENTLQPNTDPDFRQNLFTTLQKTGIIDGIKSQLRVQLLNKLQGKLAGPIKEEVKAEQEQTKLKRRIICSLIADYLQKSNFLYTQSVFIPETGFSGNMLSVPELEQILKIPQREVPEISLLDFLVQGFLDESLEGHKRKAHEYVQTEESTEGLTLDQKLRQIDMEYSSARISERILPFKELEERMLKYKREVDAKMRAELASEISRIREIEMSSLRLEEASKYRTKMQEYRNELEQMHQEKLARLKQREAEVQERCKAKERELENASFEHRQRVLKDMELLQIKEQEIKKGLEVRLREVEIEKNRVGRLKEELEEKLKDVERVKSKCDERIHEEIESFKLRYDREHETANKSLLERRRELDNKEYMVQLREDKCKEMDDALKRLKQDNLELSEKYKELLKKLEETEKKLRDTLEQLSIVAAAAKRDQELLSSKDNENKLLREELNILKKGYEDEKAQSEERKTGYAETMAQLKVQLEDSKRDLGNLREHYTQAEKERAEIAAYKFEQEKARYEKAIQEKEAKIQELQRDLENEKAYNEHVANSYKAHTVAVLQRKHEDFREEVPAESPLNVSLLHDPEYLSQKNRWLELEREAEMLKSNVRTVLAPAAPLGLHEMPDRITGTPFRPYKLRDQMLYSPALYKGMVENQEPVKTLKEPEEKEPPRTKWLEENQKKLTKLPFEIEEKPVKTVQPKPLYEVEEKPAQKLQETPQEEPQTVIHAGQSAKKEEDIPEVFPSEEVPENIEEVYDIPAVEEKKPETKEKNQEDILDYLNENVQERSEESSTPEVDI